MENNNPKNLDVLEGEIRSLVETNKMLIQKIEMLKKNASKVIKFYNVVKFKNSDFSKITEPLSIYCEEVSEEESVVDYVENWIAQFYLEKPEDPDPDKLLYGENKDMMNMKYETFKDLIRINQQGSVAIKYLTLLRESASLGFGTKFKKNFEIVGNLLKVMIRDIEVKEKDFNDTKSKAINGKIQEINTLLLQIFDSDAILNCEPFKIKIDSKILTNPMIKLLGNMFPKKRKHFNMIHDSPKGIAANNFDAAVKNKGPTLILIKNNLNYIFGAYVVDKWGKPGGWIKGSDENFLFTFGSESNIKPIKLLPNGGNGIHISSCGVHLGNDLIAFCSHSCTPSVYTLVAPGYPNVPVNNTLLAGAANWKPSFMEVFEEINN